MHPVDRAFCSALRVAVIVQVLQPLFSQFHNDSRLLSLPFVLIIPLMTHAYGKREDNKTCIWDRRTTRKTTLVGLRAGVGIPGHLLPVPLLNNLHIDQVSPTIQHLCKIVRRDPINIGVPLRTDQQIQRHLDGHRGTLS